MYCRLSNTAAKWEEQWGVNIKDPAEKKKSKDHCPSHLVWKEGIIIVIFIIHEANITY
jgi:hypothetical protein